ncbi:MAG: hypothetical protein K0V04_37940 [Deltaproteobacteria bacterium]|nr:hypothetical protein [Deltaproteobacteria bacterium]
MGWPRRGIIIRLLIYVPLIGLLAWRAFRSDDTVQVEPEPKASTEDVDAKLAPHTRVFTMPDGTKREVVELSPAQAEEILGVQVPDSLEQEADEPPPKAPSADGEPSGAADPSPDAKAAAAQAKGSDAPSPGAGANQPSAD